MTGPVALIDPESPPGERGDAGGGDGPPAAASDDPLPLGGPPMTIVFRSPLGAMVIEADGLGLRALRWGGEGVASDGGGALDRESSAAPLLAEARDQVTAYFEGRLRRFSLPLSPRGTRFQRTVWGFIHEIPFGFTLRYGELADLVGSGARAVARACGANPLPLIIPCHRVVGATPAAGGYSAPGGMDTKRLLLGFEGAAVAAVGGPARRLGLVRQAGDAARP